MRRVLAVVLAAVVLSGAQGVGAQGNGQGYVPYTETIVVNPTVAGWQSTGIVLIDGIPLSISATGEATCDSLPDPTWHECVQYLGPEGLAGSVAGASRCIWRLVSRSTAWLAASMVGRRLPLALA